MAIAARTIFISMTDYKVISPVSLDYDLQGGKEGRREGGKEGRREGGNGEGRGGRGGEGMG